MFNYFNLKDTTMNSTVPNHKPQRKQLSEQLDRFERILDGLSEGLNDAITDAARAGTRMAVKDAVIEILTDTELRGKFREMVGAAPESGPAPATPRIGFWSWLKNGFVRIGQALGIVRTKVTEATASGVRRISESLAPSISTVRILGSVKRLLVVGLSAGGILAVLSYLMPHIMSATHSGDTGAVAAMTVQLGVWARRTFRVFSVT